MLADRELSALAHSVAGAGFGTAVVKLLWVPKQAVLEQYPPKPNY